MDCPKCGSVNTYINDDMGACRTCGKRWLPTGTKQYSKRSGEVEKKNAWVHIGRCRNCRRGGRIYHRNLCASCRRATVNIKWGTPRCRAILAACKRRLLSAPRYQKHYSNLPETRRKFTAVVTATAQR